MLSWTTTTADGETRRADFPNELLYPILFNIFSNDQPLLDETRNFIYADDLCVTAQYPSFTEVEHTIEEALDELPITIDPSLRFNPDETQVASFHMKNREAKMTLKVKWNNTDLDNTPHPKYIGTPWTEPWATNSTYKYEGGHAKQPHDKVINLQVGL